MTKWQEVYIVLPFEQPAGQQEERQGTVVPGEDVSGGGNGKDTPGEEMSDLCILLSWENELKGISSPSSQQREPLVLAGDRSPPVRRLCRSPGHGGGGVAAGCPGARSPGPRDEGARGVCKHGSLFSAVRTHTAEAKPCLATGRKAAAPASQSPPASRHLSSLPHPVRKAKEEWMFQLSSDTNTAWVWYLMPKGKGNLCPLPTIHTPSITSFFFRRF